MKTKIIITDISDFIFGILFFFIAFVNLIIFFATDNFDKFVIFAFAFTLGLRNIRDGIDKFYFKEENNNGKREDE